MVRQEKGPEEVPRTGRGHRAPYCQNFSSPMESPRETKEAEGVKKKRVVKSVKEVQLCLFPLVYTHITPTYPALSLPLWQRLQTEGTGCSACSSQEARELQTLPSSELDPWTSCHVSHTAPVPEAIRSLLPHASVQVTSPVSLTLHYCWRELCVHHWPTQRRCS